jgi:hypothetical protein
MPTSDEYTHLLLLGICPCVAMENAYARISHCLHDTLFFFFIVVQLMADHGFQR